MKRLMVIAVACAMWIMCSLSAFAADSDTVVALGADLTQEQRDTVLSLMGLSEEDLNECTVITITNSDEHKYLDEYIDSSVIGTKALTSVKMTRAEAGSGITVSTQNVNYCTTGMYRNALLTAGVEDRNVLVVAPFSVSGTAGLIGAIQAYEASTGDDISDKAIDTALDEIVTTGEIVSEQAGVNNEDVEALIAWLKNMIATGKLDTSDEKSIRDTIAAGEAQFGVTLSKEEEDDIVNLLKKLDSLGLNGSYLINQAENLYEKYGSDVVNQASEAVNEAVEQAVSQATQSFFQSIKESFSDFFKGLFKKKYNN